jgi:hypothetical protein
MVRFSDKYGGGLSFSALAIQTFGTSPLRHPRESGDPETGKRENSGKTQRIEPQPRQSGNWRSQKASSSWGTIERTWLKTYEIEKGDTDENRSIQRLP